MRLRDDNTGYDYMCTHVDDFKIVARDPSYWMDRIKKTFLVKQASAPDYYLGNNYQWDDKNKLWTYDCNKYCKEAVQRVDEMLGCIRKYKTPTSKQ